MKEKIIELIGKLGFNLEVDGFVIAGITTSKFDKIYYDIFPSQLNPVEDKGIKQYYAPSWTTKMVKDRQEIADELFARFRKEVFNPKTGISSLVNKNGKPFRVNSPNREGAISFLKIASNPEIKLKFLWLAAIYYYKNVDITTSGIANFFIEGKWRDVYDDLIQKDELGMIPDILKTLDPAEDESWL